MALPSVRLVGNLVADPQIKFLENGDAVAKIRVAAGERRRQETGEWVDGRKVFIDVELWRKAAENAAESLHRGVNVSVDGDLMIEEYTGSDGVKKYYTKIINATVAATLNNQTVKVMKSTAGEQQATPAAARPDVPRTAAPAAQGAGGGFLSEPPF